MAEILNRKKEMILDQRNGDCLVSDMKISRSYVDTPIGMLRIDACRDGILCVKKVDEAGGADVMLGDSSGDLVKRCALELGEYFAGERRVFDLPLKLQGTAFQRRVWSILEEIPYGETRSYRQVALRGGNEKAARAGGMASHANPVLILVPCHRMIGTDGSLTGYAAGIGAKRYLLQMEKRGL